MVASATLDQSLVLERVRQLVLSDSPDGYEVFHTLMRGDPCPSHIVRFVDAVYEADARGQGTVVYAWRGSTKTTGITQLLGAYWMLQEQRRHLETLLIQVTDASAVDNAAVMASWIKNSPVMRTLVPSLVPDEPAGWGASGYELWDNSIEYGEWRQRRTAHPSMLPLGYKSGEIIGKHPRGSLLVDDINNEQNTRSRKERTYVNSIVKGTIFPTIVPGMTRTIFVGTPWIDDDCLYYVARTGEFHVIKLPVMDNPSDSPEADKVWVECAKRYFHLNWPERFDVKEINRQYRLAGEADFARMFMLDTSLAAGQILKRDWLHTYPADKIDPRWPIVMGVDYSSHVEKQDDDKDHDYTVIAQGRLLPTGGIVIEHGWRDRLSQAEAEAKVKGVGDASRALLQGIGHEAVPGTAGNELYALLLNTSTLPIIPVTHGNKQKGYRFQKLMAPHFENARVFISDAESDFLAEFVKEWVGFPNEKHDDCLDAVYCMLWVALGALMPPQEYGIPDPNAKPEDDSPWRGVGRT
jgi:phage terminase large subunit-like protein